MKGAQQQIRTGRKEIFREERKTVESKSVKYLNSGQLEKRAGQKRNRMQFYHFTVHLNMEI